MMDNKSTMIDAEREERYSRSYFASTKVKIKNALFSRDLSDIIALQLDLKLLLC
jgi:hypothetical protein